MTGIIKSRGLKTALLAFLAALLLIPFVGSGVAVAEPMPNGPGGSWAMILDEEFNSYGMNTSVWTKGWQHEGLSGPMSGQCMLSSHAYQSGDGYLHLAVGSEKNTCTEGSSSATVNYTGGLVESNADEGRPGFSFQYGFVEWSAYVDGPVGGELSDWPGLWTVPFGQGTSHETEMDVMEGLSGKACFHLHNFLIGEEVGGCALGGYGGAWHTYGMEWGPQYVSFYYDGKFEGQEYNNTFKPQYLIMQLVPPAPNRNPPNTVEMLVDYARVWQHASPPSVTTGSATGVTTSGATLNGTVNPGGRDTHYYFQYGTSTSYGSNTGEVDAGSGLGSVGASIAISGLAPGTTYHYRLVAHNELGTSYAGDGAFTTAPPDTPWSTVVREQGKEGTKQVMWDYYRGNDGELHLSWWSGTEWHAGELIGGAMAAGTSPAVVREEGKEGTKQKMWVYYQGNDGQLHLSWWSGTEWHAGELVGGNMAAGTSPVVVREEGKEGSKQKMWVYYQGSNGELRLAWWSGTEWHAGELIGGAMATGTSPAVVREEGKEGTKQKMWVYYQGNDGQLHLSWWSGTEWHAGELIGSAMAAVTSPAVVREEGKEGTKQKMWIYFESSSGELCLNWWTGTEWSSAERLGGLMG